MCALCWGQEQQQIGSPHLIIITFTNIISDLDDLLGVWPQLTLDTTLVIDLVPFLPKKLSRVGVTNRIWSFCFDLSVARNYGRLKHSPLTPCTWPASRFELWECSMGGESVSAQRKSQMRETPMVGLQPSLRNDCSPVWAGPRNKMYSERSLSSYNFSYFRVYL